MNEYVKRSEEVRNAIAADVRSVSSDLWRVILGMSVNIVRSDAKNPYIKQYVDYGKMLDKSYSDGLFGR